MKRATIFRVRADIWNAGTQKEAAEFKRIQKQKLTNSLCHGLIMFKTA